MTPEEIAELRKLHAKDPECRACGRCCTGCYDDWPCPVSRLIEEIDTLHGAITRQLRGCPCECDACDHFAEEAGVLNIGGEG